MSKGFYKSPAPYNEPVLSYAPGTKERMEVKEAIRTFRSKQIDIPMYIGGEEIRTGDRVEISPPHDHRHLLGYYHKGGAEHVLQAINSNLALTHHRS